VAGKEGAPQRLFVRRCFAVSDFLRTERSLEITPYAQGNLLRCYSKGQIVTTTKATPRFTGLAAIGALMALALAILACGAGDANSGSTTTGK
jgi:hypothetical protein